MPLFTTTRIVVVLFSVATFMLAQDHGEEYTETMGPVAFMWPPDREWGAAQDNTAPCGSSAASGVNRTQFPLLNGQIALVAQDESWSIQVAISYSSNPTTNYDFETVIAAMRIPELAEGHQCYPIANPPANVDAGSNATLQIMYTSDFEDDRNETYYACADIIYVPTSEFTTQVPCFNATVDDYNITDTDDGDDEPEPSASSSGAAAAETSSSPSTAIAASSESSGLSGGAIAGIVVGVVVGGAALLAAVLLVWRRSQQKKRMQQQEASVRNVKWVDPAESGSNTSKGDIVLGDLRT